MPNTLYYGDNLQVLREHIASESVDLVYLDPPFKSDQNYNVLFAERDGTKSQAQIKAFGDTWHWDEGAALAYQEVVEQGGDVANVMRAFRTFLGDNDMLAYLAMMAPRLVELRRVLKSTGSIYLHCDPTASHYLKILMDAIFLPLNFRNEIIWKRALRTATLNAGVRSLTPCSTTQRQIRQRGIRLSFRTRTNTSLTSTETKTRTADDTRSTI